MKSIKELKNLKDKRVILRADFNVPIEKGRIVDPFRIVKTLPTIKLLQKKGAIIVILAHLGDDGSESLLPVSKFLQKYIPHQFVTTDHLENINELTKHAKKGAVILVENIRRFDGEKKNDKSFSKLLSSLGDIYVNDAFSVSHRSHASVVGIPRHIPGYAGLQLQEEVKELSKAFNPRHPFLFIIGGAKFGTKLPLIKKYINHADTIFIGGALANQVFFEEGFGVGASLKENEKFGLKKLVKNKKIMLPVDFVVVDKKGNKRQTTLAGLTSDENMLDIGKESVKNLTPYIKEAKFILWNGPVGRYTEATKKLLQEVASSKATSIIGGGDTVEVISKYKMENKFTFVSTGGGATLDFLSQGTLPGIKALF